MRSLNLMKATTGFILSIRKSEQVMTSDFLIDTNDKKKPQFVIQVKPLKELIKERTISFESR